MIVTKQSPYTGKENSMDLDVTEEQLYAHLNGMHAQDAFPNLTACEREFLISGCTQEDWDAIFGDEE